MPLAARRSSIPTTIRYAAHPAGAGPRRADGCMVPVELPGRTLWLRAWRATIGRVTLYLLDGNVPRQRARSIAASRASSTATARRCASGRRWRLESAAGVSSTRWASSQAPRTSTKDMPLSRSSSAPRGDEVNTSCRSGRRWPPPRRQRLHDAHAGRGGLRCLLAPDSGEVLSRRPGLSGGARDQPSRSLMALGRAPGAGPEEPFRPSYLALHGATRVNGVSALHARDQPRGLPGLLSAVAETKRFRSGTSPTESTSPPGIHQRRTSCGRTLAAPVGGEMRGRRARRRDRRGGRSDPVGRASPGERGAGPSCARAAQAPAGPPRRFPRGRRRRHAGARPRRSHARVRSTFRRIQAPESPLAKRGGAAASAD